MKQKNKKIGILLGIFALAFIFSACGKVENKKPMGDKTQIKVQQSENGMVKENGEMKEKLVPDDKIEFEDPGNDELGEEIKAMDDLINQTAPSEYSEDDLSNDAIEVGVEMK